MVHGNHNDSSKFVRIGLALNHEGNLLLVVKDVGAGFKPGEVSLPLGNRLMIARGRGILIKELMDEVTFSFKHGTGVRLKLRLSPDGLLG